MSDFISDEFICTCGQRYRVDIDPVGLSGNTPLFQHCNEDLGKHLPGHVIAVWEEKNGQWERALHR